MKRILGDLHGNRWCNCAVDTTKKMLPRVYRLADSQGTESMMNFAMRNRGIRTRVGEPPGYPRSPKALGLNHSATLID